MALDPNNFLNDTQNQAYYEGLKNTNDLNDYVAKLDQQVNNDSYNQRIQQLNQQQNENQKQGLNYYSNIKPGTYEYNYFAATDKQRGLPEGTSLQEVINYYRNQQPNVATPLLDQSTQIANPSAQLTTNYSSGTQRFAVPQSYINVQKSMPSNYTGYIGGTPYLEGKIQTSGGGYYTDPNTGKLVYSAGYHGGGGGGWFEDRGQWGTGMNMGPMVNGTVQTGGGGFYYDPSKGTYEYSAGYHGSGEHPEITGESTPGDFKSGSFGPVAKPDFSNGIKVEKYLRYLGEMGYDVSRYFNGKEGQRLRQDLEAEYSRNGGNYDSEKLVRTLTNPNPEKTDLLFSVNAQTPYNDVMSKLGGANFSRLFDKSVPTTPITSAVANNVVPASLNDLGSIVQQDFAKSYINPYTGRTEEYKRKRYKLYT